MIRFDKGRTYIMGIVNVTPDSFYDGNKYFSIDKAVEHSLKMIDDGVDIIDIGGNSTKPGSLQVSQTEEINRVIPVVKILRKKTTIPISVDTFYKEVALEALKNGADIINDVSGLSYDDQIVSVIAENHAAVVIMHMKGTPQNMQQSPEYLDVIGEITDFFIRAVDKAKKAGIKKQNIILDPGIGFGKTLEHNLIILSELDKFKKLGYPILVGASRKSFIGKLLNEDSADDRLSGTLAADCIAILNGADILRVHDVKENKQAAIICDAVKKLE